MKIIVSGASGDLGSRITSLLLDWYNPRQLILLSRNPDKLAYAREQGAEVRATDFDDEAGLLAALQGGDLMLLISTLSIGRRVEQHGRAIKAAKEAGVQHIVYTSSMGIHPQTPSISGQEHYATERLLQESGLTFTIMRNSWYADVIPMLLLPAALTTGSFVASTGNGHVAPVFKQDCARVAAAILGAPAKHENAIYEITGPDLMSFSDIAAVCSEITGKALRYENVSHSEKLAIFDAMGVNRDYAEGMMNENTQGWASNEMITYEMAIRQHFFSICSHHVELVTGEPATPFRAVLEHYRNIWGA